MRTIVFATLIAGLATACAGSGHMQTPSGRPEIVIRNVPIERIKGAIASEMLNRGYRLAKDTAMETSYEKPYGNLLTSALLDTRDGEPVTRVSYVFAQGQGQEIRVVYDQAMVTNPNSPRERRTEMGGEAARAARADLSAVGERLNTTR